MLKDKELVPGSYISILFTSDGKVGGSSGCNQYTGTYTVSENALTISDNLASTMMACQQELMDQESAYLEALAGVKTFSITGDQLTLDDASSKPSLVYQAQSQDITGTSWEVIGYNNGKQAVVSVMAGTNLTAEFDADGTLTGNSGCNEYNGPYKVNGDQITIGPLASTKKACSDPEGVMEQEAQFLTAIQSAATYQIKDNMLELRTQDGALAASLAKK